MSGKHNMRICKCGRIHMIDSGKLDKSLERNKNLLVICGGCGAATLIGADIEPDLIDPEKNCYMMYEARFSAYKDKNIVASDFESTNLKKGIEEIIYSHGIKVPMMNGNYATNYFKGKFSDELCPDFSQITGKNTAVTDIMRFIDDYNHKRTIVDMERFITDNPDSILKEISNYRIKAFDWNGTKYRKRNII